MLDMCVKVFPLTAGDNNVFLFAKYLTNYFMDFDKTLWKQSLDVNQQLTPFRSQTN